MRTNKLTGLAALLLLASCSMKEAQDITVESNTGNAESQQAVSFGAYVNRGVTTKAGPNDAMESTNGYFYNAAGGFGVFAYYTDGALYSESLKPEFMYNTQVHRNSSNTAWEYSPVKYWPNEYGINAESDDIDRVSFFAYAPYVLANPTSGAVGDATYGIVGLSRNSASGDPTVKYSVSFDMNKQVDLCWGVSSDVPTTDPSSSFNLTEGFPFIDVPRPGVAEKINFDFKHALAQLNIQIDAVVDALAPSTSNLDGTNTKIYVRSVSFEGFTTKGTLNLNSTTSSSVGNIQPNWFDFAGDGRLSTSPVTVFDGRRDGKEGYAGGETNNESPAGLNANIIQTSTATDGVTESLQNLFNSATPEASLYVIPTGEPMTITIVYDVETQDNKLATFLSDGTTPGSSIENKITKTIDFSGATIEAGKKYKVALHLGMTGVNYSAAVEEWSNESPASGTLPVNLTGIGEISFSGGDLESGIVNKWVGVTASADAITVTAKDDQGSSIDASAYTVTWSSSNTDVVSVSNDGKLTFNGIGAANVTAEVYWTDNNVVKSASFPVYLSGVTGLTVGYKYANKLVSGGSLPFETTISVGPALPAGVTRPALSGDISLSWESSETSIAILSATSTTTSDLTVKPNLNLTASTNGTTNLKATLAAGTYAKADVESANYAVVVRDPKYRGYYISDYLQRKSDNSGFELVGSGDPFYILGYIGKNKDNNYLGTPYLRWADTSSPATDENTLKFWLDGDNADANISTTTISINSVYWTLPSQSIWNTILTGTSTTKVGSTSNARYAKALIDLTDGGWAGMGLHGSDGSGPADNAAGWTANTDYHDCLILYPDDTEFSSDFSANLNSGSAAFQNNTLNWEMYGYLKSAGCKILPVGAMTTATGTGWDYSTYGDYWSSTRYNATIAYGLAFNPSLVNTYYGLKMRYRPAAKFLTDMTFAEILEIEDSNKDKIFLHMEGGFYKAYEHSAYLFHTHVRDFKLSYRFIKACNRYVISLGFPIDSLAKWSYNYPLVQLQERLCYLETKETVDEVEYQNWTELARVSANPQDRYTIQTSIIEKQPIFKTAMDSLMSLLALTANVEKNMWDPYASKTKNLSYNLTYGIRILYDVGDRDSHIDKLSGYCGELLFLLQILKERKQISLKSYALESEKIVSVRKQLDSLRRKVKAQVCAEHSIQQPTVSPIDSSTALKSLIRQEQ